MKKMIYKYILPTNPGEIQEINDKIIEILDIQYQYGKPTMWAMIDADEKLVSSFKIAAFGTGWEIPDVAKQYLGTLQDNDGYVWHYFEVEVEELHEKQSYIQMKEDALAVLAQQLGKVGATAEEASKAFNMSGLFDACM